MITSLYNGLRALCLTAACICALTPTVSVAERLQNLASVQGVRDNQLIGYGLVVGLDGSGDQMRQTPFAQQSLTNMLSQLGVTIEQGANMQVKNVASVMVTATLPAFAQPGQTVDVVVSSLGNAKSLRGGTLLMTPLKGADNNVYAVAQGNILIGGAGASSGGSSVQVNQLNGGIISNGALIERIVPTSVTRDGNIHLEMNDTDFGTTTNAVSAINKSFGPNAANAVNGRVIQVRGPQDETAKAGFISKLLALEVKRAPAAAKVIINARTGSVVMNQSVTLDEAAVAQGSLSIVIDNSLQVNQPDTPLAGGQTVVTGNADIAMTTQDGSLKHIKKSADLATVVRALNAMGATPQDLLTILQALKRAGALRADLEII